MDVTGRSVTVAAAMTANPPPAAHEVIASLPVPVVLLGPDGQPVHANAAAEDMFNISEAALRERGWGTILPADSAFQAVSK